MNVYSQANTLPNISQGLQGMSEAQLIPGLDQLNGIGTLPQIMTPTQSNGIDVTSLTNPKMPTQGIFQGVDSATAGMAKPTFMQSMTGYTDPKTGMQFGGWGQLALGAASSLMTGYLGMKQYGLAKDQLAESKRQFNKNFEAQRKSINTRLEDRQRARVASNPNAYQSVGDYMSKNRV